MLSYLSWNYIASVGTLPVNKEKESQVLWEDPQEVADRMKLVNQMKSMEKSLQPVAENDQEENDQETTGMEMETMGSINVDNLTANMMEAEKENIG